MLVVSLTRALTEVEPSSASAVDIKVAVAPVCALAASVASFKVRSCVCLVESRSSEESSFKWMAAAVLNKVVCLCGDAMYLPCFSVPLVRWTVRDQVLGSRQTLVFSSFDPCYLNEQR